MQVFQKMKKKWAKKIVNFLLKRKKNNKTLFKIMQSLYNVMMTNYTYEPEYRPEQHHYIPQFLIKNFKKDNGGIFEYTQGGVNPEGVSFNEAASLPDFYTFYNLKTKAKSLFVEKELYGFIETLTSKIIRSILDNNLTKPTDIHESYLATYVAFQYTRTPAFRAQLKNYLLYIIEVKKAPRDLFSNKRKLELIDTILKNTYQVTRKDLVEFNIENKSISRNVERDIRSHLDNLNSILQLLSDSIGNHIAESIFKKKLYILEAKDPYFFILSDNGTLIYDFDDEYDYFLWPYGWDINRKSVALFLPISPEKCLAYLPYIINNDVAKETFIQEAIILAYHQKHKFVYSNQNNSLIQENLNKFPVNNNFE